MAFLPFRLPGFGFRVKTPVFGALDASKTVREAAVNAGPVQLDPNVTLTNADGTGFGGGRLTVAIAGATAADSFSIKETGGITVSGNEVYYQGARIGTVTSSGAGGSALTVAFDAGPVSNSAATALARAVSYSSTADAPGSAARAVTFLAVDAENTRGPGKINLKIAADRDAPVVSDLDAHVTRTPEEARTPKAVDADVTVRNPDGTGFSAGSLSVHLDGATSGDDLTLANGPFRIQGTKVYLGATQVANITSSGQDGKDLTIKFKGAAKISDAQMAQLVEQVAHSTSDAAPPEGERALTFTLTDKEGDVTRASVGLTVVEPNRAPVATADAATTAEDTPLAIAVADLLANDADIDGDTLSVTGVGGAVGGTVALDDGEITFTPDADFNGAASFTYTVSDGNGGTDTATVNVTVWPVNDAPLVSSDATATFAENGTGTAYQIAASDVEGDALTYTLSGADADLFTVDADGKVTFKAAPDFEAPADAGGDNVYDIGVEANDGTTTTRKAVAITVTDVAENAIPRIVAVYDPAVTSVEAARVGNGYSADSQFSPDGTKVLFRSHASNLVEGDTNGDYDVFVKDLGTGAVTLVNSSSSGTPGNAWSAGYQFSPDGTKVLFSSAASNIVEGDANGAQDVFVKDLETGAVTLVSSSGAGAPGNSNSYGHQFSPDGSKVLFQSYASDLVEGDTNGFQDVFVKDLETGAVTLVSSSSSGVPGNEWSNGYRFSPDGTKVLFESYAANLVEGDTNGTTDVFVKDLETGALTLVSSSGSGTPGNGFSYEARFSPDGTKVLFQSSASNLVEGDTNGRDDVFVKDLETGAVTLVNSSSSGSPGNGYSYGYQFFSDGAKVLFSSTASNLVEGDANGVDDVFVKDLESGAVALVNSSSSGTAGNGRSYGYQFSPDGTKVLFVSAAGNLVEGDANGTDDVFVKDLQTGAVTLVSSSNAGAPGNGWSSGVQFSPDGTKVLFESSSTNLVDSESNRIQNIFVKDLNSGEVTLVNSSSSGEPGSDMASQFKFSPDGTKVLFVSRASNLVDGDTNETYDVFVKDLATGELTLVSASADYGKPLGLSGFLTFEDDDAADIHTVSVTPADGTIGTLVATVVPVADGPDRVEYVYQADRDAFLDLQVGETKTETFTLLIDDGNGGTVSHDVVVTLAGTNRAPDAADDALAVDQDYEVVFGSGGGSAGSGGGGDRIALPAGTSYFSLASLLGNDTDPNGDLLTITGVGGAVNGVVTLDDQGRIHFLPDDGFYGAASFTYTVADGRGGTDTATVTLDVIKANTAPTDLVLSNATVVENLAGETVGVLSATDPDGDALSYSIQPGGDGALFTLEGNELRVGNQRLDFEAAATRSVTVRATDSKGAYTEETFTIDVLDRPETVLTTGTDVFEGTAADEQVFANQNTLNPQDQLSGGDGYDILFVDAWDGVVNLATPSAFSGFEEVRLGGFWGGLRLRDGTDIRVVNTGWDNSIYLSTGRENISGGAGSERFEADRAAELSDGDVLDGGGGSDSLRLSGGGTFDLTVPDIRNIEVLYIDSSTTVRAEDEALSGFLDIYGSAGALVVTGADSLDLSGKTLHTVSVTSDNASGTVFTIDRAANSFLIQGGSGNDTLVANGFAYTDEQRALIFATTSIETIQDSSGTHPGARDAGALSLTLASDTVFASASDLTVYGTAETLSPGDALAAGEGDDTLVLAGTGTFDLSTLAEFSGFEEVQLVNDFDSSNSSLILRDGADLTVTGGAHFTSFYLSTGAEKIFGGNGGNTFYTAAPEDLTAADELHGGTGSDTLYLSGYGTTYDLRGMQIEGIEQLGIAGGTVIVDSDVLASVTSIYSYDGGTLSTPDAELDLRGVDMDRVFGGVTILSTNATGTTFTIDNADIAWFVDGGDGVDTLVVSGLSLTDSQRRSTFTYRSIEIIRDASGVYGDETANTLVGTAAAEIVSGGGGADVLTGGAGADTFVLATAAGARITDFNAVGGLVADDDILDIGALISASSFVAGDDLADFVWFEDADGDAGTSGAYLMYDADGAGAGAAVQHTQLDGLNAGDTLHLAYNGATSDLMVIL
ncbi:tandem-95 repeat protein [Xanthobacter pseudotagetidis]|uniref:tandem-95 repeat protein n=1 Tax=Xanthobacter pseudotagetidis TaxID=3119911 RepID=UPI00372ADAD7